MSHDSHDKIFGGKRVYLLCLAIWVVSLATILPDVTGVSLESFIPLHILNSRPLVFIPGLPLLMVVTLSVPRMVASTWVPSSASLVMLSSSFSSMQLLYTDYV